MFHKFIQFTILVLLLSVPSIDISKAVFAQDFTDSRGVPFMTLRNKTGDTNPGSYYGFLRGKLTAGWCGVRGTGIGPLSALDEAIPLHVPEEILSLSEVREMETQALLDSLATSAEGRPPTLYVHGFYIDFEKGCRRATVFQENAGLKGNMLWFSWPSDGDIFNYTQDEADLYWSLPELADQIIQLEKRFGSGRINVVGHSLGARGVILALYEIANRAPELRLGDVVLLAPDIDFEIFTTLLPRIRDSARSMTIYFAQSDRPLSLSARLHGYPRLGEAGNDFERLNGVEVIDASALQVKSPSGHLYHLYNPEVGDDLQQLLVQGKTAATRSNLIKIGDNIWRLKPAAQ